MKRWNVRYAPDGEVWAVRPGLQEFVNASPSNRIETQVQGNTFYCSAIDELGAMARFMEAWGKHKAKEQTNA